MSTFYPHVLQLLLIVLNLSIFSQAIVPPSRTFRYVNQGEFGEYSVEYFADYRVTDITTFPFILCFYNTTPNAFILGLRMGHRRSESLMRWVWDANRGKPVRENATLTFGSNGNLILADVDGKVAWQTNTANKDVVGLDLLPNGNMVLYDSKGKYVWQSFDHPTDTLLVGQTLRAQGGPTRLTSRLSVTQPLNGPYSFVMEKRQWVMHYQSKKAPKPLVYYKSFDFSTDNRTLDSLTFYCISEYDLNFAFELGFAANLTTTGSLGTSILTRPKYNSTYTMLRVDIDGNFRMYTYDENVDWGAWEITYTLFNRDEQRFGQASECQLPSRCGSLGVCEDDQCVACPRPQGLLGWSKDCVPPILPTCNGGANVEYYKVDGVDHYTSAYNEGTGPIALGQCRDKCSKDCKCLGFFYRNDTSKCLVVPEVGTLVKVSNSSHVGFIKISK